MPNVTDLCRNVLMTGKNLAVVLRYARKSPVFRVRVDYSVSDPSQYAVTFYFCDQAQCVTKWADWRVLLDWLVSRRSWGVDRVYFAHPDLIDTATLHPAAKRLRERGTNVVGSGRPHIDENGRITK